MSYEKINNLNDENVLNDKSLIVSVSGFISQRIVSLILDDLEEKIKSLNIDSKIKNTIIYIAVGLLQNILNYSENRYLGYEKKQISNGSFIVGYDEDLKKYYVQSSNEILQLDKEKLSKRLEYINSLSKEQLKDYYKELLKTGEYKHDHGAGIGLIDIAIKSSESLQYSFETKDDELYFKIKSFIS